MSDAAFGREETRLLEKRLARLSGRLRVDAGKATTAGRVVYAGAATYAALFVFAAVVHYLVFKTPRGDLGNMVQAVWNTTHGHVLGGTTPHGHQVSRFQAHVDPFLLVFVPFLWIWSSPLLLPIVQALAVASGALPVFWLARKHLGSSRAGAHFAFAYLLYPATQYSAFTAADGFHSVAIAAPLVLYAIWFLDEERLVAFSVVALLAFTTREEIPLAVGCLGIWYAVRKGRHRGFGIAVFAAGLAVTLFNFLWVIPHFSPSGVDPFVGRYRAVGGTPQGMVHTLFADPAAFGHAVASAHKLTYLALLLVPFLGLSLLEPLLLLGAVPDLAINLLSSSAGQTSIAYQYTAGIVPFVVAAAIFGALRFKRHTEGISFAVLATTAAVAIVSPIYVLGGDVTALGSPLVSAKNRAVSLIPPGDPVSASDLLGSHVSERSYITVFPYVGRSRWIIVDVNESGPTVHDSAVLKRTLRKYETDKAWQTVFSSHGVTVLHERPTRMSGGGS
jgi:uncharacterized membrane protein